MSDNLRGQLRPFVGITVVNETYSCLLPVDLYSERKLFHYNRKCVHWTLGLERLFVDFSNWFLQLQSKSHPVCRIGEVRSVVVSSVLEAIMTSATQLINSN